MDSALRTISYIADIGSIVVLMARRRMSQASSEDFSESPDSPGEGKSQCGMICYVFESEDVRVCLSSACLLQSFVKPDRPVDNLTHLNSFAVFNWDSRSAE